MLGARTIHKNLKEGSAMKTTRTSESCKKWKGALKGLDDYQHIARLSCASSNADGTGSRYTQVQSSVRS